MLETTRYFYKPHSNSISIIVRDELWIRFLPLKMLINRDLLVVNPDLPRLYEQAVSPTGIWADLGKLYLVL
jgi:hypothetical protein